MSLPLAKAIGQLIIATYAGTTPSQRFLTAVRQGQIGAVILMGANTKDDVATTRAATDALQSAARAGGNSGLLIMTDQEGGQVKRLPGAPNYPAAGMSNATVAAQQGAATAKVLKAAGVNVDLAPVADVTGVNGFMTQEQRTFGDNPTVVASAACAFANALSSSGVAYTLKHFPGLGDAVKNTDNEPVAVTESAASIDASDSAYRKCGRGKLALVMISSASYPELLGGSAPAVLSPLLYQKIIKQDEINALLISDSFESGAIENLQTPALKALNLGLDMVMYPDYQSMAQSAYKDLLADAEQGRLSAPRVEAAVSRVLELKRNLGLG
jgi:beta-N-acetylhexosaminidase